MPELKRPRPVTTLRSFQSPRPGQLPKVIIDPDVPSWRPAEVVLRPTVIERCHRRCECGAPTPCADRATAWLRVLFWTVAVELAAVLLLHWCYQ